MGLAGNEGVDKNMETTGIMGGYMGIIGYILELYSGMEKKMETTIMGNKGTTIRDPLFLHS